MLIKYFKVNSNLTFWRYFKNSSKNELFNQFFKYIIAKMWISSKKLSEYKKLIKMSYLIKIYYV